MQYLVIGSGGPGFSSPDELSAVLELAILPTFEAIRELQREGVILAGGLPAGDRTLVMIVQAETNDEVDTLIRGLPAWGSLDWDVTPLQSFDRREALERDALARLRR